MICPGDSGGPLICNGFQYGIASHGWNYRDDDDDELIVCGSPDVQTRHLLVHQYADWIKHVIKNTGIASCRESCAVLTASILYVVL